MGGSSVWDCPSPPASVRGGGWWCGSGCGFVEVGGGVSVVGGAEGPAPIDWSDQKLSISVPPCPSASPSWWGAFKEQGKRDECLSERADVFPRRARLQAKGGRGERVGSLGHPRLGKPWVSLTTNWQVSGWPATGQWDSAAPYAFQRAQPLDADVSPLLMPPVFQQTTSGGDAGELEIKPEKRGRPTTAH